MYRKILLIFISTFLVRFGVITQALVVFLMLIVFVLLNVRAEPFMTLSLNRLETLSLIASMISIFCGIFFVLDVNDSEDSSSSSTSASSLSSSSSTESTSNSVGGKLNYSYLI